MDETVHAASKGKIRRAARERVEMDLSGLTNRAQAAILKAGITERHYLETRFRNLCHAILQLGGASHTSRVSRSEDRDNINGSNRRESSRLKKYQNFREHNEVGGDALLGPSASFDADTWLVNRRKTSRYQSPQYKRNQSSNKILAKSSRDGRGRISRSASTSRRITSSAVTASKREHFDHKRNDKVLHHLGSKALARPVDSNALDRSGCASDAEETSARSTDVHGVESAQGKALLGRENFDTEQHPKVELEDGGTRPWLPMHASTFEERKRGFGTSGSLRGANESRFSMDSRSNNVKREERCAQCQPIYGKSAECNLSSCCFEKRRNLSAIHMARDLRGYESTDEGSEIEHANRPRPNSVAFKAKRVQDLEVRFDVEVGSASTNDGKSSIWRRVEDKRRHRLDQPASERRRHNRFRAENAGNDSVAEATRADDIVSDTAVDKQQSRGPLPTVSVYAHVGKPNSSCTGMKGSPEQASAVFLRKTTRKSDTFDWNGRWDGELLERDASGYPGVGSVQFGEHRPEPHKRVKDSFARYNSQRKGEDDEEEGGRRGRTPRIEPPRGTCTAEEFATVDCDSDNEIFTTNKPGEDGEMAVDDGAHSFCREDDCNTRVACKLRRNSKACGARQEDDGKWRQRGRGLWATYAEPALRAASATSRTPYMFECQNTQSARKGRPRSQSVRPYYGLYARSLQANGLEPKYFRTSQCSCNQYCRRVAGVSIAAGERGGAQSVDCKLFLDESLLERGTRAGDPLADERSRAPTQGIPDRLEAGRIWVSLNRRAELLGTLPPTPLREKASWMGKPSDPQYSLVEGSKGLLHSLRSSFSPPSADILAKQAKLRSYSYASGVGSEGRPPIPAVATSLMVAAANAWNGPQNVGAGQRCERVGASDVVNSSYTRGKGGRRSCCRWAVKAHRSGPCAAVAITPGTGRCTDASGRDNIPSVGGSARFISCYNTR